MAMTLRLTEAQDRALTLLAEIEGTSKQEAAKRAIVAQAARHVNDEQVRQLARTHLAAYEATRRRIHHARPGS
ncbi:CopG family transcriptional regulator [Corynebacterium aquilae]|uniref:CopG family transcriptional regulator n=1 Tax=Corynebacterium aquilae DSM 44791 TaxID=1431546 RepID=A0A1L7CD28_9CORY|nr:CopG family transcriptional regulator [Corynebacterium aquilae]APT83749.1 CopG family transcriptional regulator [Corynebacterium aquilae DSM 44791]